MLLRGYQLSVGVSKIIFFLLSLLKTSSNFIQIQVKSPLNKSIGVLEGELGSCGAQNSSGFGFRGEGGDSENLEKSLGVSKVRTRTNIKLNPHDFNSRNRTWATLVGGECCDHYLIPALQTHAVDHAVHREHSLRMRSERFRIACEQALGEEEGWGRQVSARFCVFFAV